MENINREDIQIVTRNSNWREVDISNILQNKIYNNKKEWQKFLQLFFMSLGVSFAVAGILFFFAYNWDDLHKFVKIGLIEALIISLTLVSIYVKIKPIFKNIVLTGVTMLVGVLFAVFGQIYQTGANAYDFFLGWTMAIFIWVLISNFAPLWLIFIVLINITFGLYVEQVAANLPDLLIFGIFIIMNALFLIGTLFLKEKNKDIPNWLTNILVLVVVGFITVGFINIIFERDNDYSLITILATLVLYPSGIYYGLIEKRSFYLSIIPLSVILIFSALLIKQIRWNEYGMFLLIGLFIVISVTLVIKMLLNFQKKWRNE